MKRVLVTVGVIAVATLIGLVIALGLRHGPSEADCKKGITKAWSQSITGQKVDEVEACKGLPDATVQRLLGEVVRDQLAQVFGGEGEVK